MEEEEEEERGMIEERDDHGKSAARLVVVTPVNQKHARRELENPMGKIIHFNKGKFSADSASSFSFWTFTIDDASSFFSSSFLSSPLFQEPRHERRREIGGR